MESSIIPGVPPSMFYIPNFISEQEATTVEEKIPQNRWVTLSHRRLQAVPSRLTASNTLLSSPLPDWLSKPIVARIEELGIFASAPHGINHCLVNEYLAGQGIMPHEDGAAYFPAVATVSLVGSVVLDVVEKEDKGDDNDSSRKSRHWRILQEPNSLLVTTDSAYVDTLHGIADVTEDIDLNADTVANWTLLGDPSVFEDQEGKNKRETRISLTYRDVKKVSSMGNKLFGKRAT